MKYQRKTLKIIGIDDLKNRLADNRVTPYQFYIKYFTKYSKKGYYDFLLDINFYEQETTAVKRAMRDFWRDSK